jgi:hypothetical protein
VWPAPYEFEEQRALAIRLIDPEKDQEDLLEVAFGPMGEPPPLMQPGMDVGVLVSAAVGWSAEHFGLYTLEVFLNESRQRSIAISVRDAADLAPDQIGPPD